MSTPKPEPPGFTERDTTPEEIASVPETNAVGYAKHSKDVIDLRIKWCKLDIQWWDAAEGSEKRKELETQMKEIVEKLKKLDDDTYTTGRLKQTCNAPKPSAVFPGKKLGGLKTRRRKHRNGSTRIQRHRPSRVSRRKRQTRRA